MSHTPVMLPEVLQKLAPVSGEVFVDGTFGAGGYSAALLECADCTVIAIDRDPAAFGRAQDLKKRFEGRLEFIEGCFGDVESLLNGRTVDGFVLDLGVSSFQIDEPERGFSFRFDGPLDMRMDPSRGETAADLVNTLREEDLADLIYKYGEERLSRRIARVIVARRKERKFETTADLADVVRSCVPRSPKDKIDPATRTFQALRIAVNDELGELERGLNAADAILNPGGRMVVVSFHSLEDGIVKAFFREKSGGRAHIDKYAPQPDVVPTGFDLLTKKALAPSDKECAENPRSRSAKLRAMKKFGRKKAA